VGAERDGCGPTDRLCLIFRNELSHGLEVNRTLLLLDGVVIYNRPGQLSEGNHVLYSGATSPGEHRTQLLIQIRDGKGLHFEAKSTHSFDVAADGPGPDRLVTMVYVPGTPPPPHGAPKIRYIEEPATPRLPHTTIWISKSGAIELDGRPADVEAVDKALDELSKRRGLVIYGVDASEDEPHPNAKKVIELLARQGLSVRLSVRRDFSDVVGADGRIKD
jgi:hypothetical protein